MGAGWRLPRGAGSVSVQPIDHAAHRADKQPRRLATDLDTARCAIPDITHASGEPLQQWATTLSQGPFGPVTVECVNDRVPGFGPPDAAHGPERSAIAGTNTLCDTCRALRWVSN